MVISTYSNPGDGLRATITNDRPNRFRLVCEDTDACKIFQIRFYVYNNTNHEERLAAARRDANAFVFGAIESK